MKDSREKKLDRLRDLNYKVEEEFNRECDGDNPLRKEKHNGHWFLMRGFETFEPSELKELLTKHPNAGPAAWKCATQHWEFYLAYDGKPWLEQVAARWAKGKFSSGDVSGCELNIWKMLRMMERMGFPRRASVRVDNSGIPVVKEVAV